jgi:hypothetical protein
VLGRAVIEELGLSDRIATVPLDPPLLQRFVFITPRGAPASAAMTARAGLVEQHLALVIGPTRAYRGLPDPPTRNLNELPPVLNKLPPYRAAPAAAAGLLRAGRVGRAHAAPGAGAPVGAGRALRRDRCAGRADRHRAPDLEPPAARRQPDSRSRRRALALAVIDPNDWRAAVGERLDVLVTNAGIIHVNPCWRRGSSPGTGCLPSTPPATLRGMQAAIPAAGGGSIINVASVFGVTGSGLHRLHREQGRDHRDDENAALEHAHDGIRVDAICPGGVSTPMTKNEPEGRVVPLTPLAAAPTSARPPVPSPTSPATTPASSPAPS